MRPAPGRLTALARDFPAWDIQRVSLHPTWVAVTRRGTLTHVLAAHDLDALRAKLAKAESQASNPMSDDTAIDRASIRHAYQQVADAIAARIAAGQYPCKLPRELDLAGEFGVAYATVRRAMAILRERGLIVTIHGRGPFNASESVEPEERERTGPDYITLKAIDGVAPLVCIRGSVGTES